MLCVRVTLYGAWHSERDSGGVPSCLFIPIQSNLKFCGHLCCNSISYLTGSSFFFFFCLETLTALNSDLLSFMSSRLRSLLCSSICSSLKWEQQGIPRLGFGAFTGRPGEEIPGQGMEIPQVASIAPKPPQTKGNNSSRLIKLLCGQENTVIGKVWYTWNNLFL